MLREAKKEDSLLIASLIVPILKDMELPVLNLLSEQMLLESLSEAIQDPTYRYGYARGLVYEQEGNVVGIAFGYPSEAEPMIDRPYQKVVTKYKLEEEIQLFIESETLPNEWYLDLLSVNSEYQGLGIGSRLLDGWMEKLNQKNVPLMGLNVDQQNPRAKKLYEAKGFKKVTEMEINGHDYDHMQRVID